MSLGYYGDGTMINFIVRYKGKLHVESALVSSVWGSLYDPKTELKEINFQMKKLRHKMMKTLKHASKNGNVRKARTVSKLRVKRRARKVR